MANREIEHEGGEERPRRELTCFNIFRAILLYVLDLGMALVLLPRVPPGREAPVVFGHLPLALRPDRALPLRRRQGRRREVPERRARLVPGGAEERGRVAVRPPADHHGGEGGRPRYHHGVVPVDTPRLEIWFRPTPPGIAPRPGRAPGDHPQVPYANADDFAQAIDEGEDAVLELGQPIVREMWADTLYDDLLPVAERPGTEMNLMYSSPQNPITVVVAR